MTLAERLTPILVEIESTMIDYDFYVQKPYNFSYGAFRAITKMFINAILDKMWTLQELEMMEMADRCNMSEKAGNEIRKIIKTFTGIDSREFYKPKKQ